MIKYTVSTIDFGYTKEPEKLIKQYKNQINNKENTVLLIDIGEEIDLSPYVGKQVYVIGSEKRESETFVILNSYRNIKEVNK